MKIRDATRKDVEQISAFLRELTALGKRTRPDDEAFVLVSYINEPDKIVCSVAEENGEVLGFQSLKEARNGNQWGVTEGWGIIGTHVKPSAFRRGVGRALFDASKSAALDAGLPSIDASIAAKNREALAYYQAMGFRTYRKLEGTICKRFDT